jgi:hypothetical protein
MHVRLYSLYAGRQIPYTAYFSKLCLSSSLVCSLTRFDRILLRCNPLKQFVE